jgi:hypothetical protein
MGKRKGGIFLEDPEGCWREVIYKQKSEYQNALFTQMQGAYF